MILLQDFEEKGEWGGIKEGEEKKRINMDESIFAYQCIVNF